MKKLMSSIKVVIDNCVRMIRIKLWVLVKFIAITCFLNIVLCGYYKVKLWNKTLKRRHKFFAIITIILIGTSFMEYGYKELNTYLVILYFTYVWGITYLVKYLSIISMNQVLLRAFSILIFLVTITISFLLLPLVFDLIYFKGVVFKESGSFMTMFMILLIFISPALLTVSVRGLGCSIKPEFNYRRYALIFLTIITVMKVFNDFDAFYKTAHNKYNCNVEEQSEYCEVISDSFVEFEEDSTLWMMNEVTYQSMVIVFLLDNIIVRKEYLNNELK